jgi:hypothetical protein
LIGWLQKRLEGDPLFIFLSPPVFARNGNKELPGKQYTLQTEGKGEAGFPLLLLAHKKRHTENCFWKKFSI